MTYTLTLAHPGDWLNANQRHHWTKRRDLTRYWRLAANAEARREGIRGLDRAHVVVTYHRADRRTFDPANLAPTSKAIVDGLVDAGVWPDDNYRHVIGPDERYGEPGVRRIVVTIEVVP